MTTVTFDTFKYVEKLEEAGVDRKQAAAFVDLVKESHSNNDVATKGDINIIRSEIKELELTIKAELLLLRWMLGFISAGILSLIIKSFF